MNDIILISDFNHYTSLPLVFIRLFCNEIYRERYFNLFSHIYSRKTVFERLEEKDGYFAFKNEINDTLVFIENKRDYPFILFIQDTRYRLYYNYKVDQEYSFSYKKYLLLIGKRLVDKVATDLYEDPIKYKKSVIECVDFINYISDHIKIPNEDKQTTDVNFQKL